MIKRPLLLATLTLLSFCLTPIAFAFETPWEKIPHGRVRIVATHSPVAVEKAFFIGLEVELEEHWHTYWHNPGESGAGAVFELTSKDSFQQGRLLHLPPKRIPGPLMTFGYEGRTRFWRELRTNVNKAKLDLKVDVELLVCKDVCIPGNYTAKIQIPVSDKETISEHFITFERDLKLFERLDNRFRADAIEKGKEVEVQLTLPPKWQLIDMFPHQGSGLSAISPELLEPNKWLFKKAFAERTSEPYLMLYGQNYEGKRQSITVPVAYAAAGGVAGSLFWFFLMAIAGGVILNLMPCVFPVISIKLLGFLKKAEQSAAAMRTSVFAYVAGILVSFWLLALAIVALRAGGEAVGWGFQLQSPSVLAGLALLFFVLSLSFLDFFEFNLPFFSQGLSKQSGLMADFSAGFLTTIVASPCTAPFMGAAIGFAFTQGVGSILLIFTGLGLGLAAPYLLFVVFPGLRVYLPRPGVWMATLKQFMAFPLLATAIWLLYLLSFSSGALGVAIVLLAFLGLSFVIWLSKQWLTKSKPRFAVLVALLLGFLISTFVFLPAEPEELATDASGKKAEANWVSFSPQKRAALLAEGKAVFIDFTAKWCVTCQVNKRLVLNTNAVQTLAKDKGIVMMQADWTKRDEVITKELSSFGRIGVPFYVLYLPGKSAAPVVLPEVLTYDIVREAFNKVQP